MVDHRAGLSVQVGARIMQMGIAGVPIEKVCRHAIYDVGVCQYTPMRAAAMLLVRPHAT